MPHARVRPWAFLETPRSAIESEIKEMVADRDFEDTVDTERRMLLHAFAQIEQLKFHCFARAAFLDVTPDARQDAWLHVATALRGVVDDLDFDRIAELMAAKEEDPAAEESLELEAEEFERRAMKTIQAALRESDWYQIGDVKAFLHRFDMHRQEYEITEDLADDKFQIELTMPGRLVAHNGDDLSGGTVTWKFGGPMFRDRDLELMATSVVE